MKLRIGICLVAFAYLGSSVLHGQTTDVLRPGVVVETIQKNSEADRAGLVEGDVVSAWSRGDARGKIESPFDLAAIEIEQAPRGPVTLEGLRDKENKAWTLGQDAWGIQVRPNFAEAQRAIYREGQGDASAGNLNQAEEKWRALAARPEIFDPAWLRPWLFYRIATSYAGARQWKESDQSYQYAIRASATIGPEIRAQLHRAWGSTFMLRSDWPNAGAQFHQAMAVKPDTSAAEDLTRAIDFDNLGELSYKRGDLAGAADNYQRALRIREKLAPGSLVVTVSLSSLGIVARPRGDLSKSEDYLNRALVIHRSLARGSLAEAATLNGLGNVTRQRGNLAKAEEYYHQSLEIREQLAPGSVDVAASLNNLGNIVSDMGDLIGAEDYYAKSLAITQKLAPGSMQAAMVLNNLDYLAEQQGDLVKAEEYQRQSLAIREKLAPGSLDVALSLSNLGSIAWRRGDLYKAEQYQRKSLAIREKLAPNSLDVAASLNKLGDVLVDKGDLVQAEQDYVRSMAIWKRLAPESVYLAMSLDGLGLIARGHGNLLQAEGHYHEALAIREKTSPFSVDLAWNLDYLGSVAKDRGDLTGAEQYYRRAVDIWEKLAPTSGNEASALAGLASLVRRSGQLDAAAQLYEQSLNALERQTARLGGSDDIRARFRGRYAGYYKQYVDLLIHENQPAMAFHVVERLHARALLETLAAGHVDIRKGVNASLLEQERSLRADITAKSAHHLQLLSASATNEQLRTVENEIKHRLEELQDLEGRIRSSSPVYAALTQPQPLNAREVQQQLLDADTVLLEYSLGEDRSFVFAVTPNSLEAFALPKRAVIEAMASRLDDLLRARDRRKKGESSQQWATRIAQAEAEYPRAAARLSRIILGPVAGQIAGKRLLIISDGALHYIPFAALPAPERASTPLVLWHEIINLPSASVLAVLRREQTERQPGAKMVAVFADPVFDTDDVRVQRGSYKDELRGDSRRSGRETSEITESAEKDGLSRSHGELTRSAREVGWRMRGDEVFLPRLRFTRREAAAIAAIAPQGQSWQALDFRASRANATRQNLANYRIVHFATHALINNRHPELSGLVLSLVDEQGKSQNGFLGLQDIYNLDLPAELVVLSACATGLGKAIEGEGLVGLTRGFIYAGASRVLASLWEIDDRATAEMMQYFYHDMIGRKMRPAAALRSAQIQMWRRQRWSSPYFWAAFQLQGDWK